MQAEQRNSAGTIRVVSGEHVAEYSIPEIEGRITIDVSASEPEIAAVESPGEDDEEPPGEQRPRPPGLHWLAAVLPALLAGAGFVASAVAGPGLFVPGRSPLGAGVYALLVPFYLLALAGTRWLVADAERLRRSGRGWQPNPWRYVAGGALAIVAPFAAGALAAGLPSTTVLAALFGRFVVALPAASVVAGPVYVLQRYRRLGTPG